MKDNYIFGESQGESTQMVVSQLDLALDEELNDYENFIQNTDYAFELEARMKKGVKKEL